MNYFDESIFEKAIDLLESHRAPKRKKILFEYNAAKKVFSLISNVGAGPSFSFPKEEPGLFLWFVPQTQSFCLQKNWRADTFQENVRFKYLEFLRLVRKYDRKLF